MCSNVNQLHLVLFIAGLAPSALVPNWSLREVWLKFLALYEFERGCVHNPGNLF